MAVLTLFVSSGLFFYDVYQERCLLTERDLGPYFIPPRFFWVESIKKGDFPLWNPYQFSGHPFFANPQHAILYPLNSLFFFLPFDLAFNAIIILHFFLGGLFTYIFLRDLKVNVTGSLISGVLFMLSGYLLSVHSLLNCLLSVIWTPLIMMFFRRAILSSGLKNEILTALFITLSFFGGGVEIVYGNFFVLLFLAIFLDQEDGIQAERDRQWTLTPDSYFVGAALRDHLFVAFTKFRSLFVVSILFIFLSAIQLIPFLELWAHSIRSKGISYQEATVWSFAPKDVLLFFLPDAYGYFVDMKRYWVSQCWLKTLYTGGLPFILSSFFFLFGKRRRVYLSLLILSLFLALGQYNPLYPLVHGYVPFFNGIRYPVKFLYIFILVLSITAGLGFQRLTELSEEGNKKRLKNFFILFSLASGFLLLFFMLGHERMEHFLKSQGIDFPSFYYASVNLYHAKRLFFYVTLFFLLLRIGHEVQWKGWTGGLLVLFLIADLFGNMGFYGKEKTSDYFRKTRIQEIVSSDPGPFRILSTAKTIAMDVPILLGNATHLDYLKEKHLPTMNLLYKFRDVWGIDVIHLRRTDDLYRALISTPSVSSSNLIDLYGVKYLISVTLIEKDPRFELIYSRLEHLQGRKKDLLEKNTLKLYKHRRPHPRGGLVRDFKVLESKQMLPKLVSKDFHPEREVYLEEEPAFNFLKPPLAKLGSGRAGESMIRFSKKVTFLSESNNRLGLRVETQVNSLFVLSDTYYPGWKAYVDGKGEVIYRANYNFRAIPLMAGKHQVEFIYDPLSFKVGAIITLFATVVCIGMGLGLKFRGIPRKVFKE